MKSKCLLILFLLSNYSNFITSTICDDGSECPGEYTCCKSPLRMACCPLSKSKCCEDGYHCCPEQTKCNLKENKCQKEEINGTVNSEDLHEMTPTSLIYKKGWNLLFYNCSDDLKLIREDLISIFSDILRGHSESLIKAKEDLYKLISDSKITGKDCINFLKEVFG